MYYNNLVLNTVLTRSRKFNLSLEFKEGFNVRIPKPLMGVKARLGLISDETKACTKPDSFIGFGTAVHEDIEVTNSAGNFVHCCIPDNGLLNTRAIGYVMAR